MNINKMLFLLISCILITIVLPVNGFSELQALDDNGLSDVYAQAGFASFTITDTDIDGTIFSETKARFNIKAYTFTEIDSLKLGYHDEYDYKNPTPTYGWDEDWENVQLGGSLTDPSQDFFAEGFYFAATFTDINDSANRELKSFKFGFDYVQGPISADFINYSGTIDDSNDNTPEYNGHIMNLGPVTITADPGNTGNGGMEISLNIENYDKGYWVTFDNAVVTP
jgi:hypothetical protein